MKTKDSIGITLVKPLVSKIITSVKVLDTRNKEDINNKKMLLNFWKQMVNKSKLTRLEKKQVIDAMKLYFEKGI